MPYRFGRNQLTDVSSINRRHAICVAGEPGEYGVRLVDLSPTEASIARLIANQKRDDAGAYMHEWAAFLGPNGHLGSASHTQVGQEVAEIVRKEAAGLELKNVPWSIVQFDEPKPKTTGSTGVRRR